MFNEEIDELKEGNKQGVWNGSVIKMMRYYDPSLEEWEKAKRLRQDYESQCQLKEIAVLMVN